MVPEAHAARERQGAGSGDDGDGGQAGHALTLQSTCPLRALNSGFGDINLFSEPVCLRLLFKEQAWRARKRIS